MSSKKENLAKLADNLKETEIEHEVQDRTLAAQFRWNQLRDKQVQAERQAFARAVLRQSASDTFFNEKRQEAEIADLWEQYKSDPIAVEMSPYQWLKQLPETIETRIKKNIRERKKASTMTSRDGRFLWQVKLRQAGRLPPLAKVPKP